MGYTHYFQQKKTVNDQQWEAFEKDAKIIIDHAQQKLGIVLMSNTSDNILINNERVNLNGDANRDLDHEDFFITKDDKQFNFCKTALKPYDLVVCSLLLLAHEHMPFHYNISSDGGLNEWQNSMTLNAQLFGYGFKLPNSVDNNEEVEAFENLLASKYATIHTSDTVDNNIIEKHSVTKNNRFNL